MIGPTSLLALTFVIGVGFTFYIPAQQALVNDLVPRTELPPAVALAAVAFNVARAVGPALAGAVAAWMGSGTALMVSALFFVGMIFALRGWPTPERAIPGVPETLLSGVQSGLRYLRHSPPLRAFVIRNLSFTVCASALWALLPVIARDQLGLGRWGLRRLARFLRRRRDRRSAVDTAPPAEDLLEHRGHRRGAAVGSRRTSDRVRSRSRRRGRRDLRRRRCLGQCDGQLVGRNPECGTRLGEGAGGGDEPGRDAG